MADDKAAGKASPTADAGSGLVPKKEENGEQTGKKRKHVNAFAELMAPKVAAKTSKTSTPSHAHRGFNASFRDGLGVYLRDPAALMASAATATASPDAGRVLFYTDAFVAVRDRFPKSSVHCLLLPRDPAVHRQHPVALLNRTDPAGVAFRAAVRAEAATLRAAVAAELRERFGGSSAQDAARVAVMMGRADAGGDAGADSGADADADADDIHLPAGRDWAREVLVGVHLRPSMNDVHIHVLSRDMHSDRLRNRKHYNSFTTPFFVPLDAFPLAPDDPRRPPAGAPALFDDDDDDNNNKGDHDTPSHPSYLKSNMHCWRCGRDFGNRFQELKRHLDVEFEAWRKE